MHLRNPSNEVEEVREQSSLSQEKKVFPQSIPSRVQRVACFQGDAQHHAT